MLKLSGVSKSTCFQFEDVDGDVHELKVTQYSVKDHMKLIELQRPLVESKKPEELLSPEEVDSIETSRVVCSVKKEDGSYFWDSIADFHDKNYPKDLLESLGAEVLKLNPYPDSIAEKKSKS